MRKVFFVSDLHGKRGKYEKLFHQLKEDIPEILFIGGDILPPSMLSLNAFDPYHQDFISNYLKLEFQKLREELVEKYPEVYIILGNDDPRFEEAALISAGENGLWTYLHDRNITSGKYRFFGYSFIPPSPFLLKDWEKFDISRYVDVGAVSPLEGERTFPASYDEIEFASIQNDLEKSLKGDLSMSVLLFHVPPYDTSLDLADIGHRFVDHVPLDPHIGSIAVKRLIEERQPYITLHGHAHETVRLSGQWCEKIGSTVSFSAACEDDDLVIISFTLEEPGDVIRRVL
ncbi:MAG: metallophosphoesterase [Spirochaetales bacterium]|nr:metallophosphoesterase [Spirochaetales bacterium]